MEKILSLILTAFAIFIAAKYVLKKYNATFIFFTLGLVLLTILVAWKRVELMGDNSSGNLFLDVFSYIGTSTKKQLGGVGANLMVVAGYAAYMTYIGASDKLANALTKPLLKIGNPYLTMAALYIIGTILKMVITSHAGLALLLMATVFPVLVKLGISKLSAAAAVVACGSIDWGTNDGAVLFAAENVSNMSTVQYFTSYQWLPGVLTVLSIAITMAILFKRQDEKTRTVDLTKNHNNIITKKDKLHSERLPFYYIIFPALPLVLVIAFAMLTSVKMDIFTANVIGLTVVLFFEMIRHKNALIIGEQFKEIFRAMGQSFANIVTLIIAAGYFADGLIKLGGINIIFEYISNINGAKVLTLVALSMLTYFAVIILGSGNASWFAFGPLVPEIGQKVGLKAFQIAVPMQLSSSIGRALSPVAAAVIAVAGLAEVSTDDLIKKNIVPLFIGGVVNIISSYIYLVLLK